MKQNEPIKYIWNTRTNTLKAGSILLGIEPKELCERLNADTPSVVLNKLAEAKNKIKALKDFGDKMFDYLSPENQDIIKEDWEKTKNLYD